MPSLQCERSALLLCGLGLALATALDVRAGERHGEEFSVTARGGDQSAPHIAIGPTVGYVVWQDNGIDGKSFGIGARRFNHETGVLAPPFKVNQIAAGPQQNPQVAMLKSGGAAFVWQGGRLGGQDIYFRTHLPNWGLVPKNDVRVNTVTKGSQHSPVIACLTNGNLAVAWCSLHEDKHMDGVYARVMRANGQAATKPIRVNQFTGNNQRHPAIAGLANGHFVVVWVSENQGVSTWEIMRHTNRVHVYARVFGPGGVAQGNEFRVNTLSNLCSMPSVAPFGSNGFTITWAEKSNGRLQSWDICARTFSASATPLTDTIMVNSTTYGDQFAPKIAAIGSEHMVVWTGLVQDGSREGVFGRFLSNGELSGTEIQVNTYTNGPQKEPAIAGSDAKFLTTWSTYLETSAFDVHVQAYASGTGSVPPALVTTLDANDAGAGGQAAAGGGLSGVVPAGTTSVTQGSSSGFRITINEAKEGKRLTWNTEAGGKYQVQYSTNFMRWENLGEARPAAAASDSIVVNDDASAVFYRVIRLP